MNDCTKVDIKFQPVYVKAFESLYRDCTSYRITSDAEEDLEDLDTNDRCKLPRVNPCHRGYIFSGIRFNNGILNCIKMRSGSLIPAAGDPEIDLISDLKQNGTIEYKTSSSSYHL